MMYNIVSYFECFVEIETAAARMRTKNMLIFRPLSCIMIISFVYAQANFFSDCGP